ncbi:hypothetical protein ACQP0I_19305 [Micromonospora carbonacea]|uniref:hypothetical protein n=1 Tax=Micromonospora carbonacea TaxID=47853 RepID=UPI003D99B34B
MNEADRLRAAMRSTERGRGDRFDVEAIMREGRRLRRRRAARSGAVMLAVVAAIVGTTVALRRAEPPPWGAEPAATAPATPSATPPTDRTPAATDPPSRQALGEIVRTGIRYGDDERVFYFTPVAVPDAPGVTVGLVAGRRAPDGRLTPDHLANDIAGGDRRPGFHQIGYEPSARLPPANPVPTFGYFVGPAAQITGTVDGRAVTARLARWSEDTDVVVFWFPPQALSPGRRLDGIVARDASGRQL